jgi:hypothetical protein
MKIVRKFGISTLLSFIKLLIKFDCGKVVEKTHLIMWQYTKVNAKLILNDTSEWSIPYEAFRQELKGKTKMGAKNLLWLRCIFVN